MRVHEYTDQGLTDMLKMIGELRSPLAVRAQDATHRADLAATEADSLNKIVGFLDVFAETIRDEKARRDAEKEAGR